MEEHVDLPPEFEHYERKIYDQEQLIQISKALTANLDIRSLIESILSVSLAQAKTFKVGIFLSPNLSDHDFVLYNTSIGFEVDHYEDFRIRQNSEIVRALAGVSRTIALEEIKKFDFSEKDKKELLHFDNLSPGLLLVPLKTGGRVNGIIVLGPKTSGEKYVSDEKVFISDLASIAAIAVENARLYEMATVDMKTKLKMHHYFINKLTEEIEETAYSSKPLSIFMIDIDHFKIFNDKFGHQLGDIVLIRVAEILLRNLRSSDIGARYGGEEFSVILPGTSLADAVRQAERTRKAIENERVENSENPNGEKMQVTVSIGVAQYNAALDKNLESLINRCDKALYKAKANGRNRIEVAGVE